MIILKTLKWGDCFSYGADNEIQLNKDTLTQIIGTNGTGKSSIPLILEEVLYNKNSKGVKKASIPHRVLKRGYWINLTFSKDRNEYEINLVRKGSIKVKLLENGTDISSHTAPGTFKTIQGLMDRDFKTFSQLIYQNTSASLQFLTATDTVRKKFLIDLFNLDEYTRLSEVFKAASKSVSTKMTALEANIATIEKWLKDNKLEDTTILPMLNLDIDTEEDEKLAHTLAIELQNISENNNKITKNNQYKKMLGQVNLREADSIKVMQKSSYDKIQLELGVLQNSILGSRKIVNSLEKLGKVCPTCNQEINKEFFNSLINKEVENINSSEEASKQLQNKIAKIKQDNAAFQKKQRIQKDWEDLYRSIDNSIPEELLDSKELANQLDVVKGRVRKAKAKLSTMATENQNRTQRNTKIQVILEQTDAFVADLDVNVLKLEKSLSLFGHLEILKRAFGPNGLLAYKIENMVKDLESLVNEYLVELSDGRFTIEFVVNKDKLNVKVTDDGYIVDISDLSTGELARVNTGTLLAIRKLMSSISKSKINVLFLDEVISVLDDEGKERLVEVLLKEEDLNTFAVAHAWTHPLLEKITVTKEDKVSKLES